MKLFIKPKAKIVTLSVCGELKVWGDMYVKVSCKRPRGGRLRKADRPAIYHRMDDFEDYSIPLIGPLTVEYLQTLSKAWLGAIEAELGCSKAGCPGKWLNLPTDNAANAPKRSHH